MNLALFDFDGTITSADTFTPFIYFSASRLRVGIGAVLLSPMIACYKLGLVQAPKMRAAVAYVCFRGRSADEVCGLGNHYAQTIHRVVRPEALERIRWHQENGDRVIVVSASLEPYLRPWCERQGLELLCTTLESQSGLLSGRYAGADCTGPEKARRVLEHCDLTHYEMVYAYGDTAEDSHLLALATKRYFGWQELTPESAPA